MDYNPWGREESDMTEQLSTNIQMLFFGIKNYKVRIMVICRKNELSGLLLSFTVGGQSHKALPAVPQVFPREVLMMTSRR